MLQQREPTMTRSKGFSSSCFPLVCGNAERLLANTETPVIDVVKVLTFLLLALQVRVILQMSGTRWNDILPATPNHVFLVWMACCMTTDLPEIKEKLTAKRQEHSVCTLGFCAIKECEKKYPNCPAFVRHLPGNDRGKGGRVVMETMAGVSAVMCNARWCSKEQTTCPVQ